MPSEIQPPLALDVPVKWGDYQTREMSCDEFLKFCQLERQNLVRVITVWVEHPGYKVKFMERK